MKIERVKTLAPIVDLVIPESANPPEIAGALNVDRGALTVRVDSVMRPVVNLQPLTWDAPGSYQYIVPRGIHQLRYTISGAGGGGGGGAIYNATRRSGGAGGSGALLEGVLDVTPGEVIDIHVGSGGSPGQNSYGQGARGIGGSPGVASSIEGISSSLTAQAGSGGGGATLSSWGSVGASGSPPGGSIGGDAGNANGEPTSGDNGYVTLSIL